MTDAGDDDALGALPQGWLEITVRRRTSNPAWDALQARKARLVEASWAGLAAQLPPELDDAEKGEMRADIETSIGVQFAYVESRIDRYLTDEITVHVNAGDAAVAKEWAKIAEALGVEDDGE
ncbi:MAG: hypothetical protein EBZ50_11655 [Alphaproteobacteria bacterium]|nr:hypothetical protein [Alphaproteobacteria bacterium]